MSFIPLSVPNISGNEKKYVNEALDAGWISAVGSFVNRFECEYAKYLKVDKAVAVSNGTSGLHLAYLEAGITQGDLVLCPTLTFIATTNPIRYCNAQPLFLDCDDTLCLDPQKMLAFLEKNCYVSDNQTYYTKTNQIIRAVVVVHVFGNMADMEAIMKITEEYPMCVIEDAAEAIGTYYTDGIYKGKFAGTIGDFGVYSFNGNKIISCGGGGLVVAKDLQRLEHIKFISTQAKTNAWYFIHDEVGYNYRLTNISAAIGVAQLENLEDFITIKHNLYETYKEVFTKNAIKLMPFNDNIRSNQWFFSILVEPDWAINKDELLIKLKEQNIEARPVWGLNHEQLPYVDCIHDDLSCALGYQEKIVNIPCSTNLTIEEAKLVANIIVSLKKGEN